MFFLASSVTAQDQIQGVKERELLEDPSFPPKMLHNKTKKTMHLDDFLLLINNLKNSYHKKTCQNLPKCTNEQQHFLNHIFIHYFFFYRGTHLWLRHFNDWTLKQFLVPLPSPPRLAFFDTAQLHKISLDPNLW